MAGDIINEASACSIRVNFFDEADQPEEPQTVHWRLRDLTNCRLIQDWIEAIPQTDSEGTYVLLEITPSQNAISNGCHCYQEHVVSVQADQGLESQFAAEQRYLVANLTGFTS